MSSGRREKKVIGEAIGEEKLSDNFPEVIKDTKYWYQQGQWVPSRISKNKSTLKSSEHQREKEEKRANNLDFFCTQPNNLSRSRMKQRHFQISNTESVYHYMKWYCMQRNLWWRKVWFLRRYNEQRNWKFNQKKWINWWSIILWSLKKRTSTKILENSSM